MFGLTLALVVVMLPHIVFMKFMYLNDIYISVMNFTGFDQFMFTEISLNIFCKTSCTEIRQKCVGFSNKYVRRFIFASVIFNYN